MATCREKILSHARLLRCSFCSFACTHGHKLRLHIEQHMQPTVISCPFCSFQLPFRASNKYRFRDHLYLHVDEDLKCTSCDYTHRNFGQFLKHVHTHSDNFVCDACSYSSRNKLLFIEHVKKHQAVDRITADPCLECPACGTASRTHKHTVEHLKEHMRRLEYGCQQCCKQLPSARAFKHHMFRHHLILL